MLVFDERFHGSCNKRKFTFCWFVPASTSHYKNNKTWLIVFGVVHMQQQTVFDMQFTGNKLCVYIHRDTLTCTHGERKKITCTCERSNVDFTCTLLAINLLNIRENNTVGVVLYISHFTIFRMFECPKIYDVRVDSLDFTIVFLYLYRSIN